VVIRTSWAGSARSAEHFFGALLLVVVGRAGHAEVSASATPCLTVDAARPAFGGAAPAWPQPMTRDEQITQALAFTGAAENYPFGDDLLTVKSAGRYSRGSRSPTPAGSRTRRAHGGEAPRRPLTSATGPLIGVSGLAVTSCRPWWMNRR
jgi:hypothetical protein